MDALHAFLELHFPSRVAVLENRADMLRIRVQPPKADAPVEQHMQFELSSIFSLFEDNKSELFVQDYSVSQTSIEQIFNQFAGQQEEETANVVSGFHAANPNNMSQHEISTLRQVMHESNSDLKRGGSVAPLESDDSRLVDAQV